jgi:hypothetical protein
MERLKGDIATILDAQNEAFLPALPPPPRPWPGFDVILDNDRSKHPSSWLIRLSREIRAFLSPARITTVSVVVILLMFYSYSVFHVKTVSAKEVLQKIEVADEQRSTITKNQVVRERVHIRKTRRGQASPKSESMDTWKSPNNAYWNIEHRDSVAADLRAKYQALKIPTDLPLSASSMKLWGMAAGGNPTASLEGADVNLIFAKAPAKEAEAVERVTLLIEAQSWHVKQMTLDFSDVSFEVTEDEYSVVPTTEVPPDLLAHLRPPVVAEPIAKPVSDGEMSFIHPRTVDLNRIALDVFATLHSLKADLGEPVTVTRSRRGIVVGLWQLPADRQHEIHAALYGKEGVQLELAAPRASLRKRAAASEQAVPADSGTALQIASHDGDENQRLVKYFGSSQKQQEFTSEALETSTTILAHLYALKGLQIQFPAERSLTPEQQSQLHSLVRDHLLSISANLDALMNQLTPLDRAFGVSSNTLATGPAAATWQGGSLDLLEKARMVDHVLRALLTTNQLPASPDSALPQIDENLSRLRAELDRFDKQNVH